LIKYWRIFDHHSKKIKLSQLISQSNSEGFWLNQSTAMPIMQEISDIETVLNKINEIASINDDISSALELISSNLDEEDSLFIELQKFIVSYEDKIINLQFNILFQDKYDFSNAVIAIHSGAGGSEAQDWAEMLLRMYLRWANIHNFKTEIISINSTGEAGIKSVQFSVKGEKVYGLLKAEKGVHRLVRISPFDAAHSRHTSFALVEVMPEADKNDNDIVINTEDIRIDTYRASGNGGQSVQKNDTAVRITHMPSGFVVTCQNERSQARNKETALLVLKSKLLKLKLEEKENEMLAERGEHIVAGWGNQIRSYVLHPYKLIKDLRSGLETSNVQDVLDGQIDEFIKSYLLMKSK